jgi:hypothetical protein
LEANLLFQHLFLSVVTLSNHKWVTRRERRSAATASAPTTCATRSKLFRQ